jgi:hypothetical protein
MKTKKVKKIMVDVDSSNVALIGYSWEKGLKHQLLVVFTSGSKKYVYYKVPEKIFWEIIQSDSIGKTLNELVIDAEYEYKVFKE